MRLVPATLVDLFPVSWWRPGNHRLLANRSIHFCVNADDVRTIEVDGKAIARGKTAVRLRTRVGPGPG